MKTLAIAVALCVPALGARAQQSNPGSGSYSHSAQHKSRSSAESKVGGSPTHPPELGSSAEGRPRAGYEQGVASATAGGRTDTGPVGGTSPRPRTAGGDEAAIERNAPRRDTPGGALTDLNLERQPARAPPTLAHPTSQEIAAAQARGRIRDREREHAIPNLSEQDVPNPEQMREVLDDPYRRRQNDLKP